MRAWSPCARAARSAPQRGRSAAVNAVGKRAARAHAGLEHGASTARTARSARVGQSAERCPRVEPQGVQRLAAHDVPDACGDRLVEEQPRRSRARCGERAAVAPLRRRPHGDRRRAGRARGCAVRGGARGARDRAARAPGRRTARRRSHRARARARRCGGERRHRLSLGIEVPAPVIRRCEWRMRPLSKLRADACRAPRPTPARARRPPRRARAAPVAACRRPTRWPTSGAMRCAASSSVCPSGRASASRAASGASGLRRIRGRERVMQPA